MFSFDGCELLRNGLIKMVRGMRFELTRVSPYAPQTYASTNSATPAAGHIISSPRLLLQIFSASRPRQIPKRELITKRKRLIYASWGKKAMAMRK